MCLKHKLIILLAIFNSFLYGLNIYIYELSKVLVIINLLILIFCMLSEKNRFSALNIQLLFFYGLGCGFLFLPFMFSKDLPIVKIYGSDLSWIDITKFIYLSTLSMCFTWIAYFLKSSRRLGLLLQNRFAKSVKNRDISIFKLLCIGVIGVFIKVYLFNIGLYGRVVSSEYFVPVDGFKTGSELRVLGSLSMLSVFGLYFKYLHNAKRSVYLYFLIFLSVEIFFVFIYGARGPFMELFMGLFLIKYFFGRTKTRDYLVISIIGGFTLVVVASFKEFSLDVGYVGSSPLNFFLTYIDYINFEDIFRHFSFLGEALVNSTNFVTESSMAIKFKDSGNLSFEKWWELLFWLLKAPLDAVVPLFLQPYGNAPSWGYWFKNEVLGHAIELKYSIAMSKVGYDYLLGGFFGVGILSSINGFFLRLIESLRHVDFLGLVLFLLIMSKLKSPDIYSTDLVYSIRYLVIYGFLISFIYSSRAK